MKPHEIKEATSWPTAHQADKRVKVHCKKNASSSRLHMVNNYKDVPDETEGCFPSIRHHRQED